MQALTETLHFCASAPKKLKKPKFCVHMGRLPDLSASVLLPVKHSLGEDGSRREASSPSVRLGWKRPTGANEKLLERTGKNLQDQHRRDIVLTKRGLTTEGVQLAEKEPQCLYPTWTLLSGCPGWTTPHYRTFGFQTGHPAKKVLVDFQE